MIDWMRSQRIGTMLKLDNTLALGLLGLLFLNGCTLYAFEKQYWRIDDPVGAEDEWETNWTIWFETEQECLAAIDETQRCRARRM